MPFQTTVKASLNPAVEGDRASGNPLFFAVAGEGTLITAPEGVIVGRFAWVDNALKLVHSHNVSGNKPDGFVMNETQASIDFGAEASMVIPAGRPIALYRGGDFFAKVTGSTPATKGAAVYANNETGEIVIGSAPAGATGTGSMGATLTAATATDNTHFTASAVTGLISVGETITGTGFAAGTTIIAQTSGTAGGAGVYQISQAHTISGTPTATTFGDKLNVTAATGSFDVGNIVTGTGIPAGAAILQQISGTPGAAGVYQLDQPATAYAASTALTVAAGILTDWTVSLPAAVGELCVISKGGN